MSFHVLQFGGRGAARTGDTVAAGRDAQIVSIHSGRPADEPGPMPADLWDAVDLAAREWERLRARGEEVRFEAAGDGGGVSATLRTLDGAVVRPLPLRSVVGDDDGPLTAA